MNEGSDPEIPSGRGVRRTAILLAIFNVAAIVGWGAATNTPCQGGDCSEAGYAEAFVGGVWVLGDLFLVLLMAGLYVGQHRAPSTPHLETDTQDPGDRSDASTEATLDEPSEDLAGHEVHPETRRRLSFGRAMLIFNLAALGFTVAATVLTVGLILVFAWPFVVGGFLLGNAAICIVFLIARIARRLRAEDVVLEDTDEL